jgi:hypothetical protein
MQGWDNEGIPRLKCFFRVWPIKGAPDAGEYVRSQA